MRQKHNGSIGAAIALCLTVIPVGLVAQPAPPPQAPAGTPATPRVIPLPTSPNAERPAAPAPERASPAAVPTPPAAQSAPVVPAAQGEAAPPPERRLTRREAREARRQARRDARREAREARQKAREGGDARRDDSAAPSAGPFGSGPLCDPALEQLVTSYLAQVEQAVRPVDTQRQSFTALRDAARSASVSVRDACIVASAMTPTGQLELVERRVGAVMRAINTLKPALDSFYAALSDEQKARFNTLVAQSEATPEPPRESRRERRRRGRRR